eukprot:2434345-Pleurochrysis_carterae.AAC.1
MFNDCLCPSHAADDFIHRTDVHAGQSAREAELLSDGPCPILLPREGGTPLRRVTPVQRARQLAKVVLIVGAGAV